MSMKKRLAIATLAVSLAVVPFSGLPLSEKGLAEKLGLSGGTTYAASLVPDTSAAFKTKLQEIEVKVGQLFPSSTVNADARASLNSANDNSISDIMDTLYDRVNEGDPLDYPHIITPNVGNLFKALIGLTLADASKINTLQGTTSRLTIQQLGALAGQTLTYSDFVDFSRKLETNIKDGFSLQNLESTDTYVDLVLNELEDLITANNTRFANVLTTLGITKTDVRSAVSGYTNQVTDYNTALKQVIFANASLEAVFSAGSIDNGRVRTPALTFAGITLGSSFITWTLTGGSGLMKIENNTIVFSGAGTDTATLTGKINFVESTSLHGLPIYSGTFTATYTPASTGGGGGGGGGVVVPGGETETPSTPAEELLEESQAALDEAAKLDVSKALTTDGDKSVATLDTDSVIKQLEEIQKTAKELQAKLAEQGVEEPLVLTLQIDLGTVDTSTGEVEINKEILKAAQELGFTSVAIAVNGVNVSLPIASLSDDVVLAVTADKDANVTSDTGNKQVSDVIDFNLSVGGQAVTSFEQPIETRIKLRSLTDIDRDLLSLARITDGPTEYYGGRLIGDIFVENRDRFSTYAVVENKVVFNDIAKVQSWAGRQIQVVAAKGAVEGKAKGQFAPNDLITRAEFAKMLTRALDLDNAMAKSKFSDVKDGHWSAAYVAAAADLGIIRGRSTTTFAPTATITRAEMATMIARALKTIHNVQDVKNENAILSAFSDAADIPSSLKAGVAFAADNNIVIGNAGKFSPNANATRAEAAVILYRAINFSK